MSIRTSMFFPEGPLYHDAPRPDSTHNEFCLSCHASSNSGGLTVEALRYKGGVPAKLDPRRQPTQPPAHITGVIPAEFVNAIDGNPLAAGSNFIDEYIQPGSSGVTPDIRNIVQVQNGQAVRDANPGTTLTRSSFNALRVNASGLTVRTVFYVNGVLKLDDRMAPFELPAGGLVNGSNLVSVTTYASNGLQSQRTFNYSVAP